MSRREALQPVTHRLGNMPLKTLNHLGTELVRLPYEHMCILGVEWGSVRRGIDHATKHHGELAAFWEARAPLSWVRNTLPMPWRVGCDRLPHGSLLVRLPSLHWGNKAVATAIDGLDKPLGPPGVPDGLACSAKTVVEGRLTDELVGP